MTQSSKIKLLVHLPNNPGDVMMGLELCTLLKAAEPELSLEYIVDNENKSLLESLEFIDKVYITPRHTIRNSSSGNSFQSLQEFINSLNQNNENTLFINLFQGESGALLANLVEAKGHIGLKFESSTSLSTPTDFWTRYVLAIPAQREANTLHAIDLYFNIVQSALKEYFDIQIEKPTFKLPTPSYPSIKIEGYNPAFKTLMIQPNSAWAGKCWPKEHWISFFNLLNQQEHPFEQIVFLGAPQDKSLVSDIILNLDSQASIPLLNTCGLTQIHELFSLLKDADFLISGDTFAMHAAAWVNCPTIALFGPSSALETGPYQAGARVFESNQPEQGDYKFPTVNHPAMLGITPEDLLLHIQKEQILNSKSYETSWTQQDKFLESIFETNCTQEFRSIMTLKNHPRVLSAKSEFLKAIQFEFAFTFLKGQASLLKDLSFNITSELLNKLEKNEKEAFQNLNHSIFWEIYRIELNSLSVTPISEHIIKRTDLVSKWTQFLNNAFALSNS